MNVTAAQYDDLVASPEFRAVRWLTATYYATTKTLSAYGYDGRTDRHLVVTGVDSLDSKRAAEIIGATGVISKISAYQQLETRRFWYSFTHPSVLV